MQKQLGEDISDFSQIKTFILPQPYTTPATVRNNDFKFLIEFHSNTVLKARCEQFQNQFYTTTK